jgi:hypothetical protein
VFNLDRRHREVFFAMSQAFIQDGLEPSWRAALLQPRHLDLGKARPYARCPGGCGERYTLATAARNKLR